MPQKTDIKQNTLFLFRRSLYIIVNSLLLILILYGTFHLCRLGYNFCYSIFGPVAAEEPPGQDKIFEVKNSDNMSDVAKRLKDDNIITNSFAFYIKTQLMDKDKLILRADKYTLNTSMNYETIIDQITSKE